MNLDKPLSSSTTKHLLILSSFVAAVFGYLVAGAFVAIVFGVGWLVLVLIALSNKDVVEAPVMDDPNQGGWANAADVEAVGLFAEAGVPIGWFNGKRVRYQGESHIVTIGLPRTGKGRDVIVPALAEYPGSCLVIDPKGELAAMTSRFRSLDEDKGGFGHEVFIINPYNLHPKILNKKGSKVFNQATFNPLEKLNHEAPGFVGQVLNLAQSLVVATGGDKYFSDSARDLVAAMIMFVCKTLKPHEKNLAMVRSLLAQPYGKDANNQPTGLAAVLHGMAKSEFAPLRQLSSQFIDFSSRDVPAIVRSAQQQLSFLDEPEIATSLGGSSFHFSDMKRKPMTVYLVLPVEELADKARWLRLLVASAVSSIIRGHKGSRVLFLLDEFKLLGRLNVIADNLGAAGGLNLQFWPILQNLGQLQTDYKNEWEGFLATAGAVQFLSIFDHTTATEVVKRAGQILKKKTSYSSRDVSERERNEGISGDSTSTSDAWENLLSPSFLYGLPQDEQIAFVPGSHKTFRLKRRPYWDIPEITGRVDDNPLHQEQEEEEEEEEKKEEEKEKEEEEKGEQNESVAD